VLSYKKISFFFYEYKFKFFYINHFTVLKFTTLFLKKIFLKNYLNFINNFPLIFKQYQFFNYDYLLYKINLKQKVLFLAKNKYKLEKKKPGFSVFKFSNKKTYFKNRFNKLKKKFFFIYNFNNSFYYKKTFYNLLYYKFNVKNLSNKVFFKKNLNVLTCLPVFNFFNFFNKKKIQANYLYLNKSLQYSLKLKKNLIYFKNKKLNYFFSNALFFNRKKFFFNDFFLLKKKSNFVNLSFKTYIFKDLFLHKSKKSIFISKVNNFKNEYLINTNFIKKKFLFPSFFYKTDYKINLLKKKNSLKLLNFRFTKFINKKFFFNPLKNKFKLKNFFTRQSALLTNYKIYNKKFNKSKSSVVNFKIAKFNSHSAIYNLFYNFISCLQLNLNLLFFFKIKRDLLNPLMFIYNYKFSINIFFIFRTKFSYNNFYYLFSSYYIVQYLTLRLLQRYRFIEVLIPLIRFLKKQIMHKRLGGYAILFMGRFNRKDRAMYQ
jgi:hypothetical protein